MASDEKRAKLEDTEKHEEDWDRFHYQFDSEFVEQTARAQEKWFLEHVNPAIAPVLRATEVYRILAVGSGTGYADRVILRCIQQVLKENSIEERKIQYTVVEPDEKAVEVCKSILGELAKEMNLEFTWEVTTMDDYLPRQEKRQFELIHFIHSLCGFGDSETRLPLCVNDLLTSSGTLAIVLGRDDSIWFKIADKFNDRLNLDWTEQTFSHRGHVPEEHKECENGHNHQLEDHNHSDHQHHHDHEHNHNEELLQVIKANKWKHKTFASSEKIDVTDALVKGSNSFFKLLGHCFNVEAAKVRGSDPQVLDEALDYLKGEAIREVINGKERRYIVGDQDIIVVYKD